MRIKGRRPNRYPGSAPFVVSGNLKCDLTASQLAAFQNPTTQASLALHELLGARCSAGLVHPVTGAAFLGAFEKEPTQAELRSDQCVQIQPFDHNVATER